MRITLVRADQVLYLALGGILSCGMPGRAADLTMVRATLSSSGVAQYDYQADVEGPTTLSLDVAFADVDDVLKSLRILDPAGTASVRLAGRQPLAETFRSLPFGQEALSSPDTLLAALIGAKIKLPASGLEGRVAGVRTETVSMNDHGAETTRHRLTIATAGGIDSVVLEDAGAIELDDERLRAQLAAALVAVAANSAQDRRIVEITLSGPGKRHVLVTDVVASAVWKASYRMTLSRPGGTVKLDADAVVENLTGQDWNDVDLTLMSGQPVIYRQRLYDALFAARPEAPVDVPAAVTPRVDAGIVPSPMTEAASTPPPPLPAPTMPAIGAASAMTMMRANGTTASSVQADGAHIEQAATQVEFHLAAPVTAASGQTMLLPMLARDVPATRVALYQPDTDKLHPLTALRLTNDTGGGHGPPALRRSTGQTVTSATRGCPSCCRERRGWQASPWTSP